MSFEINLVEFPGESAAVQMNDDQGTKWIHMYLTTSRVAIYAIVSGPPEELVASTWAFDAIRNLRVKQ
jgi:hypothetical protein